MQYSFAEKNLDETPDKKQKQKLMPELSPNLEQTSSRPMALVSSFRLDFFNPFGEEGKRGAQKISRFLIIGLMFLITHYGHKL